MANKKHPVDNILDYRRGSFGDIEAWQEFSIRNALLAAYKKGRSTAMSEMNFVSRQTPIKESGNGAS